MQGYIAFDLGAESGRAMLATLDGDKLELTEVHRFANAPQHLPGGYFWNLGSLWANLVEGLGRCGRIAEQHCVELVSLGVDTWGVDYGLIGHSGQLLGLPYCYRDDRFGPSYKQTLGKLGEKAIYDVTGVQFMPFNTLYQLVAQHEQEPQLLQSTAHMLNISDLLHYFFSGTPVNEATIASTTQMIDLRSGTWATQLLGELGLPTGMLGPIVASGTKIGTLRPEVAREAGIGPIDVIVPGSHDTASAVAAVPVDGTSLGHWAYLSSGTWSLMGAELEQPLYNEETRRLNFTNERGVENRIRFLHNLSGLWLVQECRRDFKNNGQHYDYSQLVDLAREAEPLRTLVDPGHESLLTPGDMPAKIAAFAQTTGQPRPQTHGQTIRCCLDSLALSYRNTLEDLEHLLGHGIDVLHIVGGGGKNELLNQLTADALDRPIIAGPSEATAIGNAMTQAMGAGHIRDLAHLREIVRMSYKPVTFQAQKAPAMSEQFNRFQDLRGQ